MYTYSFLKGVVRREQNKNYFVLGIRWEWDNRILLQITKNKMKYKTKRNVLTENKTRTVRGNIVFLILPFARTFLYILPSIVLFVKTFNFLMPQIKRYRMESHC